MISVLKFLVAQHLSDLTSLFTTSVAFLLFFSIPLISHFVFLPSHLFLFFSLFSLCLFLTNSLAVTQTSVLLMTCSVFLLFWLQSHTCFIEAKSLAPIQTHKQRTHALAHSWPHPSRDRRPCAAPPVSLLAACCNQS